ncbi:MAG: glycosyltransferase family 39 protein [Chloroflexi bacterium]|nr:glycosyltransferase family 39 protein [Chloroflexota bacterium]
MRAIIRDNIGLWVALTLAAGLKAVILVLDVTPFNADEAVVALMARHILQGERPVFFYGQAYLGSLDAWLIAGAFLLFGQSVLAIRVVQAALYLGTVATTYLLGLKIFADRWTATAAVLLLAVPTVLETLYTTATLGGYGETLLIGNVLLLWTIRLRERAATQGRPYLEWLLFGVLAGFGFWAFGLLGVYLLPIGIALILHQREHRDRKETTRFFFVLSVDSVANYLSALMGFALGSAPWWWATLFGAETISELGGSAIANASSGPLLHLFAFVVLGLPVIIGLRPPWAVRWLALPLAPIVLVLFMGAVGRAAKLSLHDWKRALLLSICIVVVVAFIVTPFGADPSGRYFLPLATPMALFIADLLNRARREYPRAAVALLALILSFNLWGNADAMLNFPPGFTTQFDEVAQVDQRDLPAVIDFLKAQGETRCYSNYWVTFPIAFLSNETILCSAALPYHLDFSYTTRDDRYRPYTAAVAASDRAAYITTNHPPLDGRLRSEFDRLGVTYNETSIGDFHVFYGLSRKVAPREITLKENSAAHLP